MTQRFKTARCILYRENRFLLAIHNRFWPGAQCWGLPGGQIEWGESPHTAAARELEEELQIYLPELTEVGAYGYKRAMHMVYAAPLDHDIDAFDDSDGHPLVHRGGNRRPERLRHPARRLRAGRRAAPARPAGRRARRCGQLGSFLFR